MQLKNFLLTAAVMTALGTTPLALAVSELTAAIQKGDIATVRTLLRDTGLDVNTREKDGTTPLQWAVYDGNAQAVAALIKAKVDVNAANREGMIPLALAAEAGNPDIVKQLLDAGAGVDNPMANGETSLMMAARTGELKTIQLLIDHGAKVNAAEPVRGTTPLMWAAANRNAAAVKLLIKDGADIKQVSKANNEGRADPYLAPTARSRIREYYDQVTDQGNKGLGLGRRAGDEDALVTKLGVDGVLKLIPQELVQEFKAADAKNGGKAPATLLYGEAPTPGQHMRRGGMSALHFAVRENDPDSVAALITAGADVNQLSEFGWSALLTATQNRFYRLGKYLLEHGANPNIANVGGWNPLYLATDNRNIEGGDYPTRKPDMDHLDFIKLLLAAGANANIRMASSTETRTIFTHQWLREEGATPFLRAAQSSDLELMNLLLKYGADANAATDKGVTPLMVAAGIAWVEGVTFEWSEQANKDTIAMLLKLGNKVNAQDKEDERTALMGAAHKGRNYAVQMLVDAGGDLAIRDIGSRDSLNKLVGQTWQALDYAEGLVRVGVQAAQPHPATVKLIRDLMQAKGLKLPPEGRTIDSICVVDLCK